MKRLSLLPLLAALLFSCRTEVETGPRPGGAFEPYLDQPPASPLPYPLRLMRDRIVEEARKSGISCIFRGDADEKDMGGDCGLTREKVVRALGFSTAHDIIDKY